MAGKSIKLKTALTLISLLACSFQPVKADIAPESKKVRHIVAFKYKTGTTQKEIEDIDAALMQLKTKIPQLRAIEYGDNNSPEKLNKGLNQAFILTFDDDAGRDIYLVHPEHEKFKAFALPFVEDALVIDYDLSAKNSSRNIIDLTHVLCSGIPDFHIQPDAFQYKKLFTVVKDGFADGAFSMPEHFGTHMDAPCHFYDGAESIDQVSTKRLIAPCMVIDVRAEAAKDENYRLTVDKIKEFEHNGEISANSIVLLLTGWSERWAQPTKYRNADGKGQMHFPGFSAEAAKYLAEERHVSGIGIDTLSLDYGQSNDFPVHKIGLGKGMFFLENLDNLDKLPKRGARLFVGPLRIKGGTGSPARVLAEIP